MYLSQWGDYFTTQQFRSRLLMPQWSASWVMHRLMPVMSLWMVFRLWLNTTSRSLSHSGCQFNGDRLHLINETTMTQDDWNPFNSYMSWYLALSSLINGNVSTTLTNSFDLLGYDPFNEFDRNVTIYDGSSKVLEHGLAACDDFLKSYVSRLVSLFKSFFSPISYGQSLYSITREDPVSVPIHMRQWLTSCLFQWSGDNAIGMGKMVPYDGKTLATRHWLTAPAIPRRTLPTVVQ